CVCGCVWAPTVWCSLEIRISRHLEDPQELDYSGGFHHELFHCTFPFKGWGVETEIEIERESEREREREKEKQRGEGGEKGRDCSSISMDCMVLRSSLISV